MAKLFGKRKKTISEHIRNIFSEGELDEQVVDWDFRTTTRYDVGKNIAPLQEKKMISYEVLSNGQLKKYLNADW
jgi:phage regulator Rha-like protein